MKILYVTTIGGTMSFFIEYIKRLIAEGHTVDIATNESISKVNSIYRELGCSIYNISCTRSPINISSVRAVHEIHRIIQENNYDIVHCHTPIAAACTRLACAPFRKKGLKVFYTAHGFHFYKGAPKKNWLIYYPIEKICSFFTDTLITINKEDYELAKRKFKAKRTVYIPGVGIDTARFFPKNIDVSVKRAEIGVPDDAFLILSVGELNTNKNHKSVIRAIAALDDKNLQYIIAGDGQLKDYLTQLSKSLGIKDQVHLLGNRADVDELYNIADVYVHPSFREGLPVAVMEALASGTPIICTDIRGNADIVTDGRNGLIVNSGDTEALAYAITKIRNNADTIGYYNREDAEKYDFSVINSKMLQLYFDTEA